MAQPCTCSEGSNLIQIGGKYFCEHIESVSPSCSPISCPDGYTYDEEADTCVLQYITDDLCPQNSVYDSVAKTCTEVEEYFAECVCTANVSASPQTLCNGGTTSIALTSTVPGITYQWIVSQTGVTGASSGAGSAISQTLYTTTGGTALYTITPYESGGCVGQSIQVPVTVNAIPDIIATPNTPQTVASGNPISIALSSGVVGTTFAWTVTAPSTVTGALAGSGNTITNTMSASATGAAVYHIVATTPNGCTNTLDYTVNVDAPIQECLNNFVIDINTIAGCSSHGCSSATFKLMANGVDLGFAYLSNAGGTSDKGGITKTPNLNINPDTGLAGPRTNDRYNRFVITPAQAAILAATTANGDIVFSLYCDPNVPSNNYNNVAGTCHTGAANMHIFVGGVSVYDDCPLGNSIGINVCTGTRIS